MLKKIVLKERIHDIKVARQAPVISHIFFADDNLLFARENILEAAYILSILQRYQVSCGKIMNWDKLEASFSHNVEENVRSSICRDIGVKKVMSHSNYLGLHVVFGRSKKEGVY